MSPQHQQEASSCCHLLLLAAKTLIGLLKRGKEEVHPITFKVILNKPLFENIFYGFFSRSICEIKSTALGKRCVNKNKPARMSLSSVGALLPAAVEDLLDQHARVQPEIFLRFCGYRERVAVNLRLSSTSCTRCLSVSLLVSFHAQI